MVGNRPTTWRNLLLAVITIAVTAATVLWFTAHRPPRWWAPLEPADPEVRHLAERVEYRLIEEAHKARPANEPWRLRITQEQINAWLAARLGEWIAHQRDLDWPQGLGVPQVTLEPTGPVVGFRLGGSDRPRYFAARIVTAFDTDGVRLHIDRLWHGRLRVPGDPIAIMNEMLGEYADPAFLDDPETRRWLAILAGADPIDPVIELTDGRRVRITNIDCSTGWLILEGMTLPP